MGMYSIFFSVTLFLDAIFLHLQFFSLCRRKDKIIGIYSVLGAFSVFFIFPKIALFSFFFFGLGNLHVFCR